MRKDGAYIWCDGLGSAKFSMSVVFEAVVVIRAIGRRWRW